MFVAVVCIVRLLIYAYVGIKGIENFAFENYMSIFLNLVLYVFILFYAFKYFIKENEDVKEMVDFIGDNPALSSEEKNEAPLLKVVCSCARIGSRK